MIKLLYHVLPTACWELCQKHQTHWGDPTRHQSSHVCWQGKQTLTVGHFRDLWHMWFKCCLSSYSAYYCSFNQESNCFSELWLVFSNTSVLHLHYFKRLYVNWDRFLSVFMALEVFWQVFYSIKWRMLLKTLPIIPVS